MAVVVGRKTHGRHARKWLMTAPAGNRGSPGSVWPAAAARMSLFIPVVQQRDLAPVKQARIVALKALDFIAKSGHVFKTAVNRGKAHVGHLVQLFKLGRHPVAQFLAGYLRLFKRLYLMPER